jgi:hypothetical protein
MSSTVTRVDVCFSNRPFGAKHFQTLHDSSVDVARGFALIFGIGTKALPSSCVRLDLPSLDGHQIARERCP